MPQVGRQDDFIGAYNGSVAPMNIGPRTYGFSTEKITQKDLTDDSQFNDVIKAAVKTNLAADKASEARQPYRVTQSNSGRIREDVTIPKDLPPGRSVQGAKKPISLADMVQRLGPMMPAQLSEAREPYTVTQKNTSSSDLTARPSTGALGESFISRRMSYHKRQ